MYLDIFLLGMIVRFASTSSIVSWNIFSFSLAGLKGDLGCDQGEVMVRCQMSGCVAMSDVTLCDDVAMSLHNKDWTVISGEAGGRGWPVPRDAQNKKCTVGSWRETSGKNKLK